MPGVPRRLAGHVRDHPANGVPFLLDRDFARLVEISSRIEEVVAGCNTSSALLEVGTCMLKS